MIQKLKIPLLQITWARDESDKRAKVKSPDLRRGFFCIDLKWSRRKEIPFYRLYREQGISMLSAVLRSDTAVKISIKIINAFVEMRRFIQNNAQVFA